MPQFAARDVLMDALDVSWHSEHLGYTTVDGADLGTMLVPPRTNEALDLICGRVERSSAATPSRFSSSTW